MKKGTDKWMWVMAIVLVLTGTLLLYSQNRPQSFIHSGRAGNGGAELGPMAKMAEYLQLTDMQKTQIGNLVQAQKPVMEPLLKELANGQKQLADATANGNFAQDRVTSIATQQSQTLAQLIVEQEKLKSQIYSQVLTPDQQSKMDNMRERQSADVRPHM
jgi:Spy/CpxP family protein refolding chaperone